MHESMQGTVKHESELSTVHDQDTSVDGQQTTCWQTSITATSEKLGVIFVTCEGAAGSVITSAGLGTILVDT